MENETTKPVEEKPPTEMIKSSTQYLRLCNAIEAIEDISHFTKVGLFITSRFVKPFVSKTQVQIIQYMLSELCDDYPLTITQDTLANMFDLARITVVRSLRKIVNLEILDRRISRHGLKAYEYTKGPRWYAFEESLKLYVTEITRYRNDIDNGATVKSIRDLILKTCDWAEYNKLL